MSNAFSVTSFAKTWAQTEMANGKITKLAVKILVECLVVQSNYLLVSFNIPCNLPLTTCCLKFQIPLKLLTSLHDAVNYHQLS